MNISSFSPFCWVNPLFQLEKEAFLLHTLHRGRHITSTLSEKYLYVRSLWCNDEWGFMYRGHAVFFVFFLSISAAPSTKRKLCAWWDVKWWGRSVWNLLLNNVTTGNPNSEPGITEASSHQLTQNPKMYWSPHCCWWGKPILLPHRRHGTKHSTNVAVTRAGWGREWGTKVPLPATEPCIMPPSYAIIFPLRPISTWEQCKLFKTRFSGLAIIIMMISISVAVASDYLAGNFAAWGWGSSREPTHIGRSERSGEPKKETERVDSLNQ